MIKKNLKEIIVENIDNVVYAGVVGSSLCRSDAGDTDVKVIVDSGLPPTLMSLDENTSALACDTGWLTCGKHVERPVGLIPSIFFKSIELSLPVIGDKNSLRIPEIKACDIDYINLEIKKTRFIHSDRKNYLVALVFEQLLKTHPNLRGYHFDSISLAKELGLSHIADELTRMKEVKRFT